MTFTLRPYQQKAREQVNAVLNRRINPLFVSPTGTGKTKTAVKIIEDRISLGERVYVIVPQREIFAAWMDDLAPLDPGYCNDEGFRGRDRGVYVCMMLSLVNNMHMIPEGLHPDTIITDECHHSSCVSLESVYWNFGSSLRFGMTATPIRTDGKPLGHLYDEIIQTINIREALDAKYLTEPVVIEPDEYVDFIPMKGADYDPEKQAELLGDPAIIGNVIETYGHVLPEGQPCLVACSTFDHAKQMTGEFRVAGWVAEHIHSNLPKHERDGILKRVRSGRINILCTVGIGIEGMDIPGLFGVIWLRRTMSLTIWKQFNGRVMRLAPGKTACVIIDPMGNTVIHGQPDRVFNWSLTKPGEEIEKDPATPFVKCWNCGTYNAPDNIECHWCGELLDEKPEGLTRGRKLPAIIDGKLVAITTDGQVQELHERAESVKAEQRETARLEKEESERLEEVTDMEKRRMLRDGLFKAPGRRSLFSEAVKGWAE